MGTQRARTLRTRAAGDDDDKGLPPNFAEDSPEAKAEKAREEARRELLSTPLKPTPGCVTPHSVAWGRTTTPVQSPSNQ
jgi:hypothetical protein